MLEEQLSMSAAEELLRVPPELCPDLIDQGIRERWTPTKARRARLAARAKCLESKHAQSEPSTARLEERLRALSADLEAIDPAQVSHSARREAKRLVGLLHGLIDPG